MLPVLPRTGQPENRQVVAFRRATRKDDITAAYADDGGHLVAGTFDRGARAETPGVRTASGVAEIVVQVAQHLGTDAGIEWRRGRTIEIDGHCRNHHAPECPRSKPDRCRTPRGRVATLPDARGRGHRPPLPNLGNDPTRRSRRA